MIALKHTIFFGANAENCRESCLLWLSSLMPEVESDNKRWAMFDWDQVKCPHASNYESSEFPYAWELCKLSTHSFKTKNGNCLDFKGTKRCGVMHWGWSAMVLTGAAGLKGQVAHSCSHFLALLRFKWWKAKAPAQWVMLFSSQIFLPPITRPCYEVTSEAMFAYLRH